MKVCILSMQGIQNFGSVLQAYGLKQLIEGLGHEVCFLDIEKKDNDYCLLGDYREAYPKEVSTAETSAYSQLVIKISNKIQNYLFELFRRDKLKISKTYNHYDVCVIGSDEVFNCLNSGWWGFTTQLFGNVKEADRVITYAASCGATTYEKLPDCVKERISLSLKRISGFSVRDVNTMSFVNNFIPGDKQFHLDPVLIYDYSAAIGGKRDRRLPENYCIIYSYEDRINDSNEIQAILDFCNENKLVPVTIGGRQKWCKKHYICSPFECLTAFKYSSFVITDTFHGTIFSAKYAKKLCILIRDSNANKLGDLVTRLNLKSHLLTDISKLNSIYHENKNEENINYIINKERVKTLKYLESKINGK